MRERTKERETRKNKEEVDGCLNQKEIQKEWWVRGYVTIFEGGKEK